MAIVLKKIVLRQIKEGLTALKMNIHNIYFYLADL